MANIDDIPDLVWMKILSFLTPENLLLWANLSQSDQSKCSFNRRLHNLCFERKLWRQIHWESGKVKPQVLRQIIKFMGPHTTKICIKGTDSRKKLLLAIPESFLQSIQNRCNNLQTLQLINCSVDYHSTPLRKLPQSVESILLDNVLWLNLPPIVVRRLQASPFYGLKKRFPNLKSLKVTDQETHRQFGKLDFGCIKVINQEDGSATPSLV